MHAIAVTENDVPDEAAMGSVLAVKASVDCVITNNACYNIAQAAACCR